MTPHDIEQRAWAALQSVPDPELPLLTVIDLGIIRHVRATASGAV